MRGSVSCFLISNLPWYVAMYWKELAFIYTMSQFFSIFVSGYFWERKFFLHFILPSACSRRPQVPKTKMFLNDPESGDFWKRRASRCMWTDENGRFLSKISKDNVSWFKEEIHVEASFQGPTPYHPVRQNNINVHDYHYLSGRLSS